MQGCRILHDAGIGYSEYKLYNELGGVREYLSLNIVDLIFGNQLLIPD